MAIGEYRVKVTVRNNLILSAINALGFKSGSAFAAQCGLTPQQLTKLIAMKKSPINQDGEFCEDAKKLMEALGAAPSDLWTDRQLTLSLHRNTGERAVEEIDIQHILENHIQAMTLPCPSEAMEAKDAESVIEELLDTLTPNEADTLRKRYGLGGQDELTLEQCARMKGVTKERIRQIEAKALRKLRHPERRKFTNSLGHGPSC